MHIHHWSNETCVSSGATVLLPETAALAIYIAAFAIATKKRRLVVATVERNKRQDEKLRITRCYFIMSTVHLVCLMPNMIQQLETFYPLLVLITVPLHSLGFALCPVRKYNYCKIIIMFSQENVKQHFTRKSNFHSWLKSNGILRHGISTQL